MPSRIGQRRPFRWRDGRNTSKFGDRQRRTECGGLARWDYRTAVRRQHRDGEDIGHPHRALDVQGLDNIDNPFRSCDVGAEVAPWSPRWAGHHTWPQDLHPWCDGFDRSGHRFEEPAVPIGIDLRDQQVGAAGLRIPSALADMYSLCSCRGGTRLDPVRVEHGNRIAGRSSRLTRRGNRRPIRAPDHQRARLGVCHVGSGSAPIGTCGGATGTSDAIGSAAVRPPPSNQSSPRLFAAPNPRRRTLCHISDSSSMSIPPLRSNLCTTLDQTPDSHSFVRKRRIAGFSLSQNRPFPEAGGGCSAEDVRNVATAETSARRSRRTDRAATKSRHRDGSLLD
jgi:hypothetical protein